MSARVVGSLTADDLGTVVTITHEGVTFTGSVQAVDHASSLSGEPRSFLRLKHEQGWRWIKHLPSDHVLEVTS